MLVTESGIVTLVSEVHQEKTPSPMLVTESGIVTLVRSEQLLKALSAIRRVPSLIEYESLIVYESASIRQLSI